MVLTEDDYVIGSKNTKDNMTQYFNEYDELFMVVSLWTDKPYAVRGSKENITVPNHAAISMGIINNKLYQELRREGIDFRLRYETSNNMYQIMWENQALYLEPYRKNGNLIMDLTKKHSVPFGGDITKTIEYGVADAEPLLLPVQSKFFN